MLGQAPVPPHMVGRPTRTHHPPPGGSGATLVAWESRNVRSTSAGDDARSSREGSQPVPPFGRSSGGGGGGIWNPRTESTQSSPKRTDRSPAQSWGRSARRAPPSPALVHQGDGRGESDSLHGANGQYYIDKLKEERNRLQRELDEERRKLSVHETRAAGHPPSAAGSVPRHAVDVSEEFGDGGGAVVPLSEWQQQQHSHPSVVHTHTAVALRRDKVKDIYRRVVLAREELQRTDKNASVRADQLLRGTEEELFALDRVCEEEDLARSEALRALSAKADTEEAQKLEITGKLKELITSTSTYLDGIKQECSVQHTQLEGLRKENQELKHRSAGMQVRAPRYSASPAARPYEAEGGISAPRVTWQPVSP